MKNRIRCQIIDVKRISEILTVFKRDLFRDDFGPLIARFILEIKLNRHRASPVYVSRQLQFQHGGFN